MSRTQSLKGKGKYGSRASYFLILISCFLLPAAPLWARYHAVNVPVGKGPVDVFVNAATNRIYTANARGGSITVIDGVTNQIKATIDVPCSPAIACGNQYTNRVYFSGALSPYLAVVDGTRDALLSCEYLGRGISITALCCNTATNNIYAASGDQILVVDGNTNEVQEIIPVQPNRYRAMCYNPANNRIYCAGDSTRNVTVIDCVSNTAASLIETGIPHYALCWDRKDNRIYCAGPHRVDVIDCGLNKVVTSITVRDPTPGKLCYNAANNRVYCPGGQRSDRVLVIDCKTGETAFVTVGKDPTVASADPIRNRVYIANQASHDLTILEDTAHSTLRAPHAVRRFATPNMSPVAITVNPNTGVAYVANADFNSISAVIESPFEVDIRIADVTRKQWVTPFGGILLNPILALRSNGVTTSGFSVVMEIFDVTDSATAIRMPVYAESLVVWDLMTHTRFDAQFPEFAPEPGTYQVEARIAGFPDASPAGNRMTVRWKLALPSSKNH
jgi:YVTN family beta-propeller protein